MIYIITPYLSDFKRVCEANNWPIAIISGRPRSQNIMWIHDWQQFLGRKIYKMDLIIWGEQSKEFHPSHAKRLYEEIELRKRQ